MNDARRPRVTVFVPVFDRARVLPTAIESVLAQHFDDFELLVVDDGSKDESAEVVRAYRERDPRIRLVSHEHNEGIPRTRNRGLEYARASISPMWTATTTPFPNASGTRSPSWTPTRISTPAIALDNVRRELVRLGELVQKMFAQVLPAMLSGDRDALSAVARMDEDVDGLYNDIIAYLARISEGSLTKSETNQFVHLMSIANALESVGDTIETDLVRRGRGIVAGQVRISPVTAKVLSAFHAEVARALADVTEAIGQRDPELAARVVEMKPLIQRLAIAAANHEAERLVAPEANRLPTYALEKDMIEDLRRVYSYAKRIGRAVIEAETQRVAA